MQNVDPRTRWGDAQPECGNPTAMWQVLRCIEGRMRRAGQVIMACEPGVRAGIRRDKPGARNNQSAKCWQPLRAYIWPIRPNRDCVARQELPFRLSLGRPDRHAHVFLFANPAIDPAGFTSRCRPASGAALTCQRRATVCAVPQELRAAIPSYMCNPPPRATDCQGSPLCAANAMTTAYDTAN